MTNIDRTVRAVAAAFAMTLCAGAGNPPASPSRAGASGGSPRFAALVADARTRVRLISATGLVARMNGPERPFYLIDVREDKEWEEGSLPGAIHLSRGVLERDIEKTVPDPAAPIVLFCAVGGRSILAADSLRKMGYTNAFSLQGGMRAWLDAGDPIVRR